MSDSKAPSATASSKSVASDPSVQCCNHDLTVANVRSSAPSVNAAKSWDTNSYERLDLVKKLMEWWYFAPLLFAVLMFLLVGTVFEKRIETAVRAFQTTDLEVDQEVIVIELDTQSDISG